MRDTKAAEKAADDVARGVIGLDKTQNVVALLCECQQGLGDRGDAGACRETVLSSLQLGKCHFELPRGRI